ncbi:MAG TPA: pitrilysin family protein [Candidatus Paceibacterota bacterium]|nr:pitrilysin family protein [Verrucomicrobiota bacterium]HRY51669.1 pitrilysin family protein [Candidatus Paceibacterota bacterium]
MYQLTRLDNGLRIATAAMPHMASVSLGFWVGVGGRFESADLSGASHFIEHLLFKGTRKRSARQISQDVEGLGGYLNAFTSEENTCFFAKAGHDRLPDLLDVLFDMFLHSRFDPAEIRKEREVIKEEVAMYRDQPQHYVHELLNAAQWPDQPLGRSITGTIKNLDQLNRSALLNHQRSHYGAANTFVVAAGRVSHPRLVAEVARLTRAFPPGSRHPFAPAFNPAQQPVLTLDSREIEQTQLALGIRTCSRHDPRRYALRLLNTILGENMSSRLFQILREDTGLTYSISSSLSFFEDVGDLVISAGLDTGNVPKALTLLAKELSRLRDKPPGKAELARARDYVIGQSNLSLEGTEHHMMWLGEQLLGYGKITRPAILKRALRQVTPAQIQSAARDFFHPGLLTLALVSPLKSAGHLQRYLRQL